MEYSRNLKRGLCSHDADQQAKNKARVIKKKKKKEVVRDSTKPNAK